MISMLGVALGVLSMIVVLSVMDGFEAELRNRLMGTDLHILIQPRPSAEGFVEGFIPAKAFEGNEAMERLRAHPEVLSLWPIVQTEAILKYGKKVTGVFVKGVNQARVERLKEQWVEVADPLRLTEGEGLSSTRLPSIYIGFELAREMNMVAGDRVTLISPTETEGPMSSVPRLKRFVVEAIYKSGLPEQELHTIFAPDAAVRSFIRRQEVLTGWEVTLRNFDEAPALASSLAKKEPHLRFDDWSKLNSRLFASLRLERVAMALILAIIVVVASFNIVTTLSMMVLEKKREISILKAMGARNAQVGAIFLAEGALIGGVGTLLGVVLGFLACGVLRRYEIIELPDIFYDHTVPVTFNPSYYLGVVLAAGVIVLFACLHPSQKAARISPIEGIRFG